MSNFVEKKSQLKIFLKKFFLKDFKFHIYYNYFLKIIKFSKSNYNTLSFDQLFFIFKKIDINDLDKILKIIKSLKIKIIEYIPENFISLNIESKKIKKDICDDKVKKEYLRIKKYLNILSKHFIKNLFLVSEIFVPSNKKSLKNFVNKTDDLKSNLNIKSFFYIKKLKNLKKRNKKKKNASNINKYIYSNHYFNLNRSFACLNFLTKNISKYRLNNRNNKAKILLKSLKNKFIIFKVTLRMLDDLYKIIELKFKPLNNLRYEIYDSLSNISNISYIKFNFFFLKNGNNLKWIINLLDFSKFGNSFKVYYKNYLKRKFLEIRIIEKKYSISIKKFFKMFNVVELYKLKIDLIRKKIITIKLKKLKNFFKIHNEENKFDDDASQEGIIGFLKGINNYNLFSSVKFENFLIYNIKRELFKYKYITNKIIKLPNYIISIIKKINNFIKHHKGIYNVDPDIEKISENLSIEEKKVEGIINFYKNPISIEKLIDDNNSLVDVINNRNFNFDEKIFDEDLEDYLNELIMSLNNRSINILNMRFGLNMSRRYTLTEVGEIYNLSRERIRQIQNFVLKKIKDTSKTKKLLNFFNFKKKHYWFNEK
ncbi:RNA polymerase, sigma 70 (sigma D) factor [Candidatus Nasuia deltocephalinicola str. NAS-ALF]|uniref:RNA polymerase, sigma 70 (Sigma D) factor n=1 Tax=Candidatus Nasuia deltocephalinicola str. NAS-ALF TaxID=1343077 RepID=S5SQ46_9PROT|nr:RNA polymerase, sigma 70 (sigma D) factor [Candidatus Nasuia deltocephalinicola str. NAS-ALF]